MPLKYSKSLHNSHIIILCILYKKVYLIILTNWLSWALFYRNKIGRSLRKNTFGKKIINIKNITMETTNQKTIEVLNNLLEINNDRIEGYNLASKETKELDLKNLFEQFAGTSYRCKQELIAEVQRLGGKPIEGTRTTGKLYRAWMDIKAALTNNNRKAILSSCELGEDVAVKNYENALKNTSPSSFFYSVIKNQHAIIKREHDRVKDLRDSVVSLK